MDDVDALLHAAQGPALPGHLYVHIPFCTAKCSYCDFASVAGSDEPTRNAVFSVMRNQVMGWARTGLPGILETVYFGGGTPSLVYEDVAELLDYVRDRLGIHPRAEVTVECNPDSVSVQSVRTLLESGATRFSLGVQSFDDSVLAFLGRVHSAHAARAAARTIVDAGAELSIDLICGAPGQTAASWANSVHLAAELGAGHVSVYPLTVEVGTELARRVDAGVLDAPDADRQAEDMETAAELLAEHGFERYEVANYARSIEQRSAHNQAYWTGRPYMGIGPSAHGMLDIDTARAAAFVDEQRPDIARVRYANERDLYEWSVRGGIEIELLSGSEADREDAMLGMRLSQGIDAHLAERAGVSEVLADLVARGLVKISGGRFQPTAAGWLLGNEVFAAIWNASGD